MVDDCRLTEKKMKDRRFRRAEEAILATFLDECPVNVRKMAERAGITRTSFYYHHRAMKNIWRDYDRYIFRKYAKEITRLLKRERIELKNLYFGMIRFIFQEKKIFLLFLKEEKRTTLSRMVDKLRLEILKAGRIPEREKLVYLVCRAEILALVEEWMRNGFKDDEIGRLINNMTFVTETAWRRLGEGLRQF